MTQITERGQIVSAGKVTERGRVVFTAVTERGKWVSGSASTPTLETAAPSGSSSVVSVPTATVNLSAAPSGSSSIFAGVSVIAKLAPTADVSISSLNTTTNYASVAPDKMENDDTGGKYYALYYWDLASIPAGAVIQSAICTFATDGGSGGLATQSAQLFRVTSSWTESTVTWATQPTWDTSVPLEGAGNYTNYSKSSNTYRQIDITSLAKSWYAGTASNYGVIISTDAYYNGGIENYIYLRGRRYTGPSSAVRTTLNVTYQTIYPVSAESDGTSTVTAVNKVWLMRTAASNGTSTVANPAQGISTEIFVTAAPSGSSAVSVKTAFAKSNGVSTVVGGTTMTGKASMAGSASATAAGVKITLADAQADLFGSASLTAAATVSSDPAFHLASASLYAGAALSATASWAVRSTAGLRGSAGLTVTGGVIRGGAASVTGNGSMAVTGIGVYLGAASITGGASALISGLSGVPVSRVIKLVGSKYAFKVLGSNYAFKLKGTFLSGAGGTKLSGTATVTRVLKGGLRVKKNQNIRDFTAGDYAVIQITVTDDVGAPVDLTGGGAKWALSQTLGGTHLVTKTLGSGIAFEDAVNGVLNITIEPSDTENLKPGRYYHEAEITDALNNPTTVTKGEFYIEADGA